MKPVRFTPDDEQLIGELSIHIKMVLMANNLTTHDFRVIAALRLLARISHMVMDLEEEERAKMFVESLLGKQSDALDLQNELRFIMADMEAGN